MGRCSKTTLNKVCDIYELTNHEVRAVIRPFTKLIKLKNGLCHHSLGKCSKDDFLKFEMGSISRQGQKDLLQNLLSCKMGSTHQARTAWRGNNLRPDSPST